MSGKSFTYTPTPFTTSYQEEVQRIVKELWDNDKNFFLLNGKQWLDQKTLQGHDGEFGINIFYDGKTIEAFINNEEKDRKEKVLNLKMNIGISNFEKFSLNMTTSNMVFDALISSLIYYFQDIVKLHIKIIEIYKSNLSMATKKYLCLAIIKKIDECIEDNSPKHNFMYPLNIIQDLQHVSEVYSWIDSFTIELALDAYREIRYYYEWLEKHKIEEKRFRDKISNIATNIKELRILTNAKPPFKEKLPRHPQDIIHELVSIYWDFYGREKKINDDGIQAIIKIISNYQRMPKKSIQRKIIEKHQQDIGQKFLEAKNNGATQEELTELLIKLNFEKKD